ncbi:MAG: hypothetical protein D6780_06080, partial [Candidatus Dadabacteria bacterium]
MAGEGGLAYKVRTGLKGNKNINAVEGNLRIVTKPPKDKALDKVWLGKSIRQHIREFSYLFALITLIIGGWFI